MRWDACMEINKNKLGARWERGRISGIPESLDPVAVQFALSFAEIPRLRNFISQLFATKYAAAALAADFCGPPTRHLLSKAK